MFYTECLRGREHGKFRKGHAYYYLKELIAAELFIGVVIKAARDTLEIHRYEKLVDPLYGEILIYDVPLSRMLNWITYLVLAHVREVAPLDAGIVVIASSVKVDF